MIGLVNSGNPALPGEVIHAYAIGLGPTSPEVPYGSAAPAQEPLARVVSRYPCTYGFNPSHALEILFEGLAPELAGIYQIDFRVPPEVPDGDLSIFCQASEFDHLGGTVPVHR